MTLQELREKDAELQEQISQYRIATCEMQAEIAINEKEIAKLQRDRTRLHNAYAMAQDVN